MKHTRIFTLFVLIAVITVGSESSVAAQANSSQDATPNIVLLIADDLGVESAPCYDGDPAIAPRLSAVCDDAVVFESAWSSPICSPTRAGMLTGRHSFRTGIGEVVSGASGLEIADGEWTMPRILDAADSGYATANFGKWHLGGDADKPNTMGWDHYSGVLSGGLRSYSNWSKTTNGQTATSTTYATTANVDDTIAWVDDQTGPWLAWVAFNAPHTPFHLPPSDLHTQDLSGTSTDIDTNPTNYYNAAIEALDTEIGRLMDSLDAETRDNTLFIFIGDNGNPTQVSGFPRGSSKGSLEEGGVHVPLFAWGAGVTDGSRSDALVGTIDVFATVLEAAGVAPSEVVPNDVQIDSNSFLPVLQGGNGANQYVMSEVFGSETREARQGKTIRDDQYKLIAFDNGATSFYDLGADPSGTAAIEMADQTDDERAAFDELTAVLAAWTASEDAPPPPTNPIVSAILCGGRAVTLFVVPGEELVGTSGDDVILGTSGPDTIDGAGGADRICGEGDEDLIQGGAGDDLVWGGQGADTIRGGDGNDTLHGNRGADMLLGDAGDDRIFGYSENDLISGGEGHDRLHGNFGNDVLAGGEGDDRIFGYGDDDIIEGGAGDDLAGGNFGDDEMNGGDGNDRMYGSDGDDTLDGGAGNDVLEGNSLNDTLSGGAGDDELDGGIDIDSCDGGPGNNTTTRCESG